MIYRELPTAFVWYDNIQKQSVRQETLSYSCYYGLIAPKNAILPFQFLKQSEAKPVTWRAVSRCGGQEVDLSTNLSLVTAIQVSRGVYVTYKGEDLNFALAGGSTAPLNLAPGEWYCEMTFSDGVTLYSEIFKVVADVSKFVRLEFFDESDLDPIKYVDTNFKQVVYLDSIISNSETEVVEEGDEDENGKFTATYQRLTVNHRLEAYVPDFLKIALTSMQMHSNVTLMSPTQAREGVIDRVVVSSVTDPNVQYNTVTMQLVENSLVKNSCGSTIEVVNSNPWA